LRCGSETSKKEQKQGKEAVKQSFSLEKAIPPLLQDLD
jgi:hypothetical protein